MSAMYLTRESYRFFLKKIQILEALKNNALQLYLFSFSKASCFWLLLFLSLLVGEKKTHQLYTNTISNSETELQWLSEGKSGFLLSCLYFDTSHIFGTQVFLSLGSFSLGSNDTSDLPGNWTLYLKFLN